MKKAGIVAGMLVLAGVANAEVASWTGDIVIGNFSAESDVYNSADGSSNINSLRVGQSAGGNGTLDITGGTLNVANGGLFVGNYNDALGLVNVTGGVLNVAQANNFIGDSTTGDGKISLRSGAVNFAGAGSLWMGNSAGNAGIDISGGSWNGGKLLMNLGGTAVVSVTGDAATSIWFNDSTIGNGTSTFNLTADDSGITLIDFNAVTFNGDGTQILNIDISNYDYATHGNSLTLIDSEWSTFAASDFETINIIGGSGDVTVSADGFGSVMTIENVIPEPATLGLVCGFSTLVFFIRRIFII